MKNKKVFILVLLLVIGIIVLTTSVTYAFFRYRAEGLADNTISVGGITFHYQEIDGMGRGISITDALPVSNNLTARSMDKSFDFNVTSTSGGNIEIPSTVTARVNNGSDLVMGNIVDL